MDRALAPCRPTGKLQAFNLIKDVNAVSNKGYAFFIFKDPSVSDACIAALHGFQVGAQRTNTRPHHLGAPPPPPSQAAASWAFAGRAEGPCMPCSSSPPQCLASLVLAPYWRLGLRGHGCISTSRRPRVRSNQVGAQPLTRFRLRLRGTGESSAYKFKVDGHTESRGAWDVAAAAGGGETTVDFTFGTHL